MVQEHYDDILRFYGADLGLRVARKHLGWYMDHAATSVDLRRCVLTARSAEAVKALLPRALSGTPKDIAA